MNFHPQSRPRHLVVCLGDQLDAKSAAFDGFDPSLDAVWMAEVAEESTHVWSHQARIALFLSAMRHFRDALCAAGLTVHYRQLDGPDFLARGFFGERRERRAGVHVSLYLLVNGAPVSDPAGCDFNLFSPGRRPALRC